MLLFCLTTAPVCRSDASARTSCGTLGSANAGRTFSAISRLTALKAETSSGVGCDLPFAHLERAVSGATMSARPFQEDMRNLTIPTRIGVW